MKALEINNLKKTYANGVQALNGISFSVEEGAFFALLGPNGAGKSTTIGIVSTLVNKTAGQIKIFDHDMSDDLLLAKRNIGLVPQEFNFSTFDKVIDVVCNQAGYYGVPRKVAKVRAEYYLKKLGLWEKRNHQTVALSGGLKRRLMIVRALIHEPKLLILDEPTAGVDIELRRTMWDFLQEINQKGTTVILTTHYLEEAESLCENITIIDQGNIVVNTDKKSLLRQLNTETFILDLDVSMTVAPILEKYSCTLIDEHSLAVNVKREQSLNQLFAELGQQGITITSLRNKSNRLEEMFLDLTQNSKKEQ